MWIRNHWLALLGVGITALFLFLQLLVWGKQGYDLMLVAGNIIVTVVLWVVLICAIVHYRRDGRKADALRLEAKNTESQHRQELETRGTELISKLGKEHEALLIQERSKAERKAAGMYRYFAEEVRRAERIGCLSGDIDSLWRCFDHRINTVTTEGGIPEIFQHPLSDRIENQEVSWGLPIEVWKFQQDFKTLQTKLHAQSSLVPNLKSLFANMTLPNELTSEQVVESLKDCAEKLKQESNRIWQEMRSV